MFKKITSAVNKLTNLAFTSTVKTVSLGTTAGFLLAVGLAFVIMAPRLFTSAYFQYHADDVLYLKIIAPNGRTGHGTAFHVKNTKGERYLLTNHHVCTDDKGEKAGYKFLAISTDSGIYPTEIVKLSPNRDLCLMKPVGKFKPFKLKVDISYEEPLYVIGYPKSYPLTIMKGSLIGNINANELRWKVPAKECKKNGGQHNQSTQVWPIPFGGTITTSTVICNYWHTALQTSISIRKGNSGSPLINIFGEAVGIIYRQDIGHWGQAVPAKDIIEFIEE